MKAKNILLILVVVGMIVIVFQSLQDSQDDSAYIQKILDERQQTDRFMRSSNESPFAANRESYNGLNYFPPDPRFRIIANFEPLPKKDLLLIYTNDGKEQQYVRYGYAVFELHGVKDSLLILESVGVGPARGKLFIPFGDATSAIETYGAGRYLDVNHVRGSQTITLDFNKAYNPYCAYNDTYSCPLPPRENLLEVAIRAGEKNYK